MSLAVSIARVTEYRRRHGAAAAARRAWLALRRTLFAGRMVVFYCDLDLQRLRAAHLPKQYTVKRVTALGELNAQLLQEVTSFWNPKLADRNLRERFAKGATLWLVLCGDHLAGYGWTLKGQSIAPYYFPLTPGDVQLFDFYVLPKFRGRALHWLLTSYILHALAVEGGWRAFADTHEWNRAQLASFQMTPFRPIGYVRAYKVFGRLLTCWAESKAAEQEQPTMTAAARDMQIVRSNE